MPYSIQPSYEELMKAKKNPVAATLEAAMQGKMAYNQAQEFKAKQEQQKQEAYFAYRKSGLSQQEAWNRSSMGGTAPTGEDTVGMEKRKTDADIAKSQASAQKDLADAASSKQGQAVYQQDASGKLVQVDSIPKGSKVLPASGMNKTNAVTNEMKSSITTIEHIFDTADKLIPAENTRGGTEGVGTVARGLGKKVAGAVGYDENTRAYQQFKEGVLSITIRGLGEKGVLTNQDVDRARQLLPDPTDSAYVRTTKKNELLGLLKDRLSNYYSKQGIDAQNQIMAQQSSTNQLAEVLGVDSSAPTILPGMAGGDQTPSFATEQEAEAANIPPGTRVMINGRPAVKN